MKWIGLFLIILTIPVPSMAEPPRTAEQHYYSGLRWKEILQFQRAIEEFEQAYVADPSKVKCLYEIADSYERLSNMPNKTISESLGDKWRAYGLYEAFLKRASTPEKEQEIARNRIEPLGEEIKKLKDQITERDASIKGLDEKIEQILAVLRLIQDQLMRRDRHATTATGPIR